MTENGQKVQDRKCSPVLKLFIIYKVILKGGEKSFMLFDNNILLPDQNLMNNTFKHGCNLFYVMHKRRVICKRMNIRNAPI